jgi:hypothetical protein
MEARYVRYLTKDGSKPAIVFEGRKHLHVVSIEPDVRVSKVRPEEDAFMRPVGDVKAAAKKFRSFGRRNGISQAARDLLKEV